VKRISALRASITASYRAPSISHHLILSSHNSFLPSALLRPVECAAYSSGVSGRQKNIFALLAALR
jgi:hypothetical protein